jgi:hypothetical protein
MVGGIQVTEITASSDKNHVWVGPPIKKELPLRATPFMGRWQSYSV